TRVSRLTRPARVPAEVDSVRAAVKRTKAREAAAQAKWKLMKAGSRTEDVQEAKADLDRLAAQHRLLLIGTRAEDKAAWKAKLAESKARLRELEAQIREASIVAHEPCVVELVPVRKGDLAPAQVPVVKVLRTGDLWVKTYVPETELGKVRLNMA